MEFTISLSKQSPTEQLGLDVAQSERRTLTIRLIKAGLVESWNMANPDRQLKVGDRIIAVNGFRGEPATLVEKLRCSECMRLELVAERPSVEAEADALQQPDLEVGAQTPPRLLGKVALEAERLHLDSDAMELALGTPSRSGPKQGPASLSIPRIMLAVSPSAPIPLTSGTVSPTPRSGVSRGRSNNSQLQGRGNSFSTIGTVAGRVAHCGYYILAFFAYWFGAARFDINEDGEFDPMDVQLMINSVSTHLRFSFSRPRPRSRRLRERAEEQRRKRADQLEHRRQRDEAHEKHLQELRSQQEQRTNGSEEGGRRPSIVSGTSLAVGVETVAHALDVAIDRAVTIVARDVKGEEVESTIQDNLRQYLPWFTIAQVLVCLGLWLGYALQSRPYELVAKNAVWDESKVLLEIPGISSNACQLKCDSYGDGCSGVVWKDGPASRCQLLSVVPETEDTSYNCEESSWNWFVYQKQASSTGHLINAWGGLETAFPDQTALQTWQYCEEGFRYDIFWRVVTYQYTHGGLSHVLGNCIMTLFLGIPLEGFHGTGLVFLMWTVGVIGGGFNWLLIDPYRRSCGASGGCWALLGMHVADIILNWKQKKFRWPTTLLLVLLTSVELGGFVASYSEDGDSIAHSVHAGGFVAGIIIGALCCRNIKSKFWEKVFQVFLAIVGVVLVSFVVGWWFSSPLPAVRSLWYPNAEPWCWIGQVCTNDGNTGCNRASGWQCVVCDTRQCVEDWYKDENIFCVTAGSEKICEGNFADITHNCQNC